MKDGKEVFLKIDNYYKKGLYLIFDDSSTMDLTESEIEKTAQKYWGDLSRLPLEVREAADFRACPMCPDKYAEGICFALRPVLPLIDRIEKFVSHDRVTAIYRGEENLLHIADTTMQDALQYISIMSLMQYCRAGRKYKKYYVGVIPITGSEETVKRMYLNIYWLSKGDLKKIKEAVSVFKDEISLASAHQTKRLNLICKSDVFVNAFYNTQIAAEILASDMESVLNQTFSFTED
jgi:hypothetical protein